MSTEQTTSGWVDTPEMPNSDGPEANLPMVVLPAGEMSITKSAEKIFNLMAQSERFFVYGGRVMELVRREDGILALDILDADKARSEFDKVARLFVWRVGANGGKVLKPTVCPAETAKALLASEEAKRLLPHVNGLINCPAIYEHECQLCVAGAGYDFKTKRLITGGKMPPEVLCEEAVPALFALFAEFDFQTGGDRARAVASIFTPALKLGGFITGPVPADVAEADQSQSGKTYRQKCVAAFYNEKVSLVTNRKGGVGSVDESLSQRLVEGRPFIQLDNFRGRLDSEHIESLFTAEGSFPCRIPYKGEISIRPENFFVFLSSNGVDTTRDFANRSSIIRISKKLGFAFKEYPEGDLLAHIRANQAFYLGCIFAVIRKWHAQGKPKTAETRHDFRDWVQILDWIVQNLFKLAPVMDDHQEAQERVSNPAMVLLRAVALAVKQASRLGQPLTATDIAILCEMDGISIPGVREGFSDANRSAMVIGGSLRRLFGEKDTVIVDGFRVERQTDKVTRNDGNGFFESKLYIFTKASDPATLDHGTPVEGVQTAVPCEQPFPAIYHEPGVGTTVSFERNRFEKTPEEKAVALNGATT